MEPMRIAEIARAIGCETAVEASVDVISTDSREVPAKCLFVALVGETFDGHDYVAQAFEKGAAFAIVHRDCEIGGADPTRLLRVQNTQTALMQIGRAYRLRYSIHCVGVTGSVGKTTTKDMIAAVVSAGFQTLKTEGNFNNEIGLPKTLLRLTASDQAAVLEMGMQGRGEIAALAEIACPEIGVITNIGVSHLEQLGTRENILLAKLELAEALPDGAPLILCGDNDLLRTVKMPRLQVCFYGIEKSDCRFRAEEIQEHNGETYFTLLDGKQRFAAQIPCIGRHNVCNALAACAVGSALGIPLECAVKALLDYRSSGMRQKAVCWNSCTVMEDCYNASPDSMTAALATLAQQPCEGRRIAVLGDMLELGSISRQAHYDVGAFAARQKIDLLLCCGEEAKAYLVGAAAGGMAAEHFTDRQLLVERLRAVSSPGSVIWVKASRGMKMEQILQGLYEE